MKMYETLDEAWLETVLQLLERSSVKCRNGRMREICGFSFKLMNVNNNVLLNKRRVISPTYASAELLWYLSRANNIGMLKAYAPQYSQFAEPDGTAFGAYGWRIAQNISDDAGRRDQLELAREMLENPLTNSRQVVISLWRPDDLITAAATASRDIPCTLTWQFLRRANELHMVVSMRSNDVWLGMPYDVYTFTSIQRLIASHLKLNAATYTHHVGSMHLYDSNVVAAEQSLMSLGMIRDMPLPCDGDMSERGKALNAEESFRSGRYAFNSDEMKPGIIRDSVACCLAHYVPDVPAHISSAPLLRALIQWKEQRKPC